MSADRRAGGLYWQCPRCRGAGWIKAWFHPGYNLCTYCGGTGNIGPAPPPKEKPMKRTLLPLAALLAALALPAAADTGYTIGPTACHRQHGFRPVDQAAEPFPPAGNGPLDIIAWRARYGFTAPGLDPLPIGSEPCHQCCESHWRNAAEVVTWCEQRKAADPSWPHDCRSPTKREQYDWSFGHQAVATPRPDDRCPGGLWLECPPPRLPCDEYFPPSASRPYCYTLAGSAQRLRCSDVSQSLLHCQGFSDCRLRNPPRFKDFRARFPFLPRLRLIEPLGYALLSLGRTPRSSLFSMASVSSRYPRAILGPSWTG
jgi:hypothetical protein